MREDPKPNPISRRSAWKLVAGAVAAPFLPPETVAAKERSFEFAPSTLTKEKLSEDIRSAAHMLVNNFWNDAALREHHLASSFTGAKTREDVESRLRARSRARIPTESLDKHIFRDYPEELEELMMHTPVGQFGLFVAGDSQRLYVLKNLGKGKIQFEKSYLITTSKEDWSNEVNSDGTSLGMQWVSGIRGKGILGEVISAKDQKEKRAHFGPPVETAAGPKLVTKSFDHAGNQHATVMTLGFELWNPHTFGERGELIHATNREDVLGQRASGGCIRISNVDVIDLTRYIRRPRFDAQGKTMIEATPVMTAAKGRKPEYKNQSQKIVKQESVPPEKLKWNFKLPGER